MTNSKSRHLLDMLAGAPDKTQPTRKTTSATRYFSANPKEALSLLGANIDN